MRQGPVFKVFGTSWPILTLKVPEIFGTGMLQNSRVLPRVVCLCGAVGVCGECHRVGHVVMKFTPEDTFDQKGLEICCFRASSFIREFLGKMESGCLKHKEKSASKFRRPSACRTPCMSGHSDF